MRADLYSPPLRFNMGYIPHRRQSADHTFETRPSRWSGPRGHMAIPTRRLQSPRSYLPGPSGRMSSPRGSMSSPTGDMIRRRGVQGGQRDRSPGPRDRSSSPRDGSSSPRDRSSSPRDRSPSPRGIPCDFRRRHQDSAHAFAWEGDQLHAARVPADRPLGASPSPERESPTCSELPAQKSPHGPDSRLCNFCQPANNSPDTSCGMASRSAASRLSPSHLAEGALQQGNHSPVHDPQQLFQHAVNGPRAQQVELLHSPIARRKLDMGTADKTSQETVPSDSSNTGSNSTAALAQADLEDQLTLPDLHAVVSDASSMPLAHTQDRADAAATKRRRQTPGGKSLLKKVLRKSLVKQDGDCRGLSGSDAYRNSSQDVIYMRTQSAADAQTLLATAGDTQRPQHAEHSERASTKKSRRAKRPQPADSEADSSTQALLTDAQARLQDDRTKHKSKRRRRSQGECSCHKVWPCIMCSSA